MIPVRAGRHLAFIGVGANLGAPLAACRAGIAAIAAEGIGRIVAVSRFYHTAPQDYAAQQWFVNAAAAVETRLAPLDLLARLKAIEMHMGRSEGGPRFGPRPIDLDILLYDDRVIDAGALVLPHPRLHKRRFALQPLCDIAPETIHPVLKVSMAALLAGAEIAARPVELLEI
ncbi:MAG: 2-amino-4-hydroxy-6-hydroxymethyldihydropteridine diphosphokinase [Deltaproteobacteria bacterium]|nr:2-amino-4-hydroxy-6-hydroxymethyldihydropteridine diphosphokinase [Deltaproteobacteria bacterium]